MVCLKTRLGHYLIPVQLHFLFFFFNDTATTEIYTLSLHDALPIRRGCPPAGPASAGPWSSIRCATRVDPGRSEEHTSELQSHVNLVCRLLLEKKKKQKTKIPVLKKKKQPN